MINLSLSILDSLLHLTFAVLALLAARRLPRHVGSPRHAWQMLGFVFLLYSVADVSQMLFGTMAFVGGPESAVWPAYMRWMPILNHSRTVVMWGLYVLLGVLAAGGARSWPVLRRAYVPFSLAMVALGGLLGVLEGPFDAARHLSNTSLMDALAFIVLAVLLFVLMLRDTVDRALWLALLFYGSSSVMSSLFLAAIAWINAHAWTPSPWIMEVSRVAFTTAMVSMAVWRLRLARRGVPLAGLLGTNRPRPVLA
jgi:hypothetical protein